jgi:hypothetical protein
MTSKNGWKGESERHMLASRGARTAQTEYADNILKYSAQGMVMPSAGIKSWLQKTGGKINDALHSGYDRLKYGKEGQAIGDEARATNRKIKNAKLDAEDAQKKLEKTNAARDKVQTEALIKAKAMAKNNSDYEQGVNDIDAINKGIEPTDADGDGKIDEPITDADISKKIGAMTTTLAKTEYKPPVEEMDDINLEMFESVDADIIIAVSENREKLILYESKLKRTIDLFDVEKKAKLDEYHNEEEYLNKQIRTEKNLAQANMNTKIKNIQTSGMPKESVRAKVDELKNEFKTTYANKEAVFKNLRRQHKADTEYIQRISSNLDKSRKMVEKRMKSMSAGGIKEKTGKSMFSIGASDDW